jgi:hypothetical protein
MDFDSPKSTARLASQRSVGPYDQALSVGDRVRIVSEIVEGRYGFLRKTLPATAAPSSTS